MSLLYKQPGGTYQQGKNGLLYPNLLPSEEDAPIYDKYSRVCLVYLREHHRGLICSISSKIFL